MPTQTYCIEQDVQEGQVVSRYSIWREGRRIPLFDILLPSDPHLAPELTVHSEYLRLRVALDAKPWSPLDDPTRVQW